MPQRLPKYVRHKARNRGKVTINGKTHYLPGEYGSPESVAAYDRLIAECLTKQDRPDVMAITLNRLAICYIKDHCNAFYVKADGSPAEELAQIKRAVRPVLDMFGSQRVCDFGPRKLKRYRDEIGKTGITRRTINERVSRVVRMLEWGVAAEYVQPYVLDGCKAVRNLQRGRCGDIPEGEGVDAVDPDQVEAVLPELGRVLSAMVRLQSLTGMRPQEVRLMKWAEVDTSDRAVWCYCPGHHKTAHHGKSRRIFIGPEAQRILMDFLKSPDVYIFDPRESESERNAHRRQERVTPMKPSDRNRSKGKVFVSDHYSKDAYARAIKRACERAFDMPKHLRKISGALPADERKRLQAEAAEWRAEHCWSPNQLRHLAATEIARKHGLDGARQVLGHSEKSTTEVYAEKDFAGAKEIMREIG